MESGGFEQSDVSAVSGQTKKDLLKQKRFISVSLLSLMLSDTEKQSEPISSENEDFHWTNSDRCIFPEACFSAAG